MPTYDYQCARCGAFAMTRPIARRNDPAACPACGRPAGRLEVSLPMLARLPGPQRAAHAANERAANAPYSSRELRQRHGAGCGCCGPARSAGSIGSASSAGSAPSAGSATSAAAGRDGGPPALKSFPARRPWQISH